MRTGIRKAHRERKNSAGHCRCVKFVEVSSTKIVSPHISAVRSGMGEEAWEEAWRKGRAMTLDETVSYTLEREAGG